MLCVEQPLDFVMDCFAMMFVTHLGTKHLQLFEQPACRLNMLLRLVMPRGRKPIVSQLSSVMRTVAILAQANLTRGLPALGPLHTFLSACEHLVESAGMAPGTLTVKFLAAYDLKNMDIWPDLSDPYVVVKVGGQEAKTKVIQNNLNPVWNETFDFTIDMSEVTVIDIQVFDENSFRKDAPLGKLSIPTSSLSTVVEKKREKLQDVGQGELEYEVCFKKEVSSQAVAHTPTPEFTHQIAREFGFVSDIKRFERRVMSSIALLTTDFVFLIYFFFNFSIIGLISSIALFLIAGGFINAKSSSSHLATPHESFQSHSSLFQNSRYHMCQSRLAR